MNQSLKNLRIPKYLFENEKYKKLTNNSRVLYGFLLDVLNLYEALGKKNQNSPYIFVEIAVLAKVSRVSMHTVRKSLSTLVELGLIEYDKPTSGTRRVKIYII